jgi:hypothetical protein
MKELPAELMTPPELTLWKKMVGWDRYFADMRFETRALRRFLKILMKNPDGVWVTIYEDLPGMQGCDISDWELHFRPRMEADGLCDRSKKAIFIRPIPDAAAMRATVLHEMIHAYEAMLIDRYQQILCLVLRGKLRGYGLTDKKFIKLLQDDDFLARSRADTMAHSVLFMLKALALDLQLHLPLGTIHGYGREESFKHFRLDERPRLKSTAPAPSSARIVRASAFEKPPSVATGALTARGRRRR